MQPRFAEFSVHNVRIKFPEVEPPKDFEFPAKFPECCRFHSGVNTALHDWFGRFPNCCEAHREIERQDWFCKEEYSDLPREILHTLVYAQYYIEQRITGEDYYKDITGYFEDLTFSFGHPSIGAGQFQYYLKIYLQHYPASDSPADRVQKLLHWFDESTAETNEEPSASLTALEDVYQKWLAALPFSIPFFQRFKPALEREMPFLSGGWEEHTSIGMVSSKLCTRSELILRLNKQTQNLLKNVDTAELVAVGEITDVQRLRLDILGAEHKNRQRQLLYDYAEDEQQYLNTINSWLQNEKAYFAGVAALFAEGAAAAPSISVGNNSNVQVQVCAPGSSQSLAGGGE